MNHCVNWRPNSIFFPLGIISLPGYRQSQQLSSPCSRHNTQSMLRKVVDLDHSSLKTLMLDQACRYLNESSLHGEFNTEYAIIIFLLLGSPDIDREKLIFWNQSVSRYDTYSQIWNIKNCGASHSQVWKQQNNSVKHRFYIKHFWILLLTFDTNSKIIYVLTINVS